MVVKFFVMDKEKQGEKCVHADGCVGDSWSVMGESSNGSVKM